MPTAYELRSTSSPEFDWQGGVRVRRSFIVDARPEEVQGAAGLPVINDAHPTFTTARVDSYGISGLPGKVGWSSVEVLYSSDRQFTFPVPPLDPNRAGFNSWSISFTPQTIEVPVAKRITRNVINPVTGASVQQETWAYGPDYQLGILTTFAVIQYRFTLTEFNPAVWPTIMEQVNKIHRLPDGRDYRYESGDITQTTETVWNGTHSWVYDPGNFSPDLFNTNPVGSNGLVIPNNLSGPPTPVPFFRPPYSQWTLVDPPGSAGTGAIPHSLLVRPYDEDLNGWQNLPGIA